MALIIEDGTMPAGANSYASISDADAWHTLRGTETWPGDGQDEEAKVAALVKAADYLNGLAWHGTRAAPGRTMAWPRVGVVDGDGFTVEQNAIPVPVINAQCYLAGAILDGADVAPVLERGGRVASVSVGNGAVSQSFFEDAANRDVHTAIMDMLRGLATGLDGVKRSGGVYRAVLG